LKMSKVKTLEQQSFNQLMPLCRDARIFGQEVCTSECDFTQWQGG
jgi:hypothetical protein